MRSLETNSLPKPYPFAFYHIASTTTKHFPIISPLLLKFCGLISSDSANNGFFCFCRLIKTKKTRGRMLFAETWTLISFVDLTCSSQARILLHLIRSDRCPLGPEWAHQWDKHKVTWSKFNSILYSIIECFMFQSFQRPYKMTIRVLMPLQLVPELVVMIWSVYGRMGGS